MVSAKNTIRYWWVVDRQVLPVTTLTVAAWCNDSGEPRGRIVLATYDEAVTLAALNWQRSFR